MSGSTELGISPVLLQAIKHKLATKGLLPPSDIKTVYKPIHYNNCVKTRTFEKMDVLRDDVSHAQKVVAHILQDMNEPVSELLARGSANQEQLELDQSNASGHLHKPMASGDHSDLDLLRQQLVKNQSYSEQSDQSEVATENPDEQIITCITDSDMSMVNVLTAIASHHLKSSRKSVSMPVQFVSTPAQGAKSSDDDTTNMPQSQYVVCYGDGVLPSPAANVNDIVVSQADSPVSMDYMQNIYVNQHTTSVQDHAISPAKKLRTELHLDSNICESNGNFITDVESTGGVSVLVNPDTGSVYHVQTGTPTGGPAQNVAIGGPCPICGDRVSGYHYGIFSCESCKGFFKRTVQNKKSFVCVRSADCKVNIASRKKCPSCRFEKCLLNGMRLEAIRSDRTRGGRSYYDGCSPHGKSKPGQGVGPAISQSQRLHMVQQGIPDMTETDDSHLASSSSSQLVAILNRPSKADKTTDDNGLIKPYVPQILTDIMNLESFLSDEDLSQEMGQEKLNEDDMYTSLMQLTELRLYKLVRWARNLPQFSAIATDDQILLLQHCWSDLLVLGVCWPSIQSANELRLAFGKSIDRERAIAMDVEDMYDRMMNLTSQLRRLHVDNYEYVALKVLILISPDVKGLKDPERIRDQQDKICDALHVYTGSHYPKYPNKFGEMLLRLPEISRCSIIGKEYLSSRQITGDLPSCSLLLELIRGENEVKES